MNYDNWISEVKQLLLQLRTIDFGFPLDENILRDPSSESFSTVDQEMAEFYSYCDGLSWPDVANGYFIRKRSELGCVRNEYEPTSIVGDLNGDITVFGSTGSGILFARRSENGQILSLPHSRIEMNVYQNSDSRAKVIANSFQIFLTKIKVDLEAFVKDTAGHKYLA